MWSQTIVPTTRSITVEVPEAMLNQAVEVVLVPAKLAQDREARRGQIAAFFSQFQADAKLIGGHDRAELNER